MAARSKRLTALFCGSTDWKDGQIIFACMWGLYEIIDNLEEALTIVHTNDKGAGKLAGKAAWRLNSLNKGILRAADLIIEEYAIDPDQFTPIKGYARNEKMLDDNNPDTIFAFCPDVSTSPGTQHLLDLAKDRGIQSYLIQRYS
jgi:hypothetical protein